MSDAPLWRQAFDRAERAVAPRAEGLVRTPGFFQGAAILRRAQTLARDTARDVSARAWHLLNLPAGSDVTRLRAQLGALDREIRRLGLQLEAERRANRPTPRTTPVRPSTEDSHADGAQPADGARPRPARRRTQRAPGT
jgi:hypothetical protein